MTNSRFGGSISSGGSVPVGANGDDSNIANLDVQSVISPSHTSWNTEVNRKYQMPLAGSFHRMNTFLNGNTNVSDGANIVLEIDSVPTALLITVDQATGAFFTADDDTVSIPIARNEIPRWRYNEGSVGGDLDQSCMGTVFSS